MIHGTKQRRTGWSDEESVEPPPFGDTGECPLPCSRLVDRALLGDLHANGLTIMLITHAPAVAARGGRTLSIRDGRGTE